MRAGRPPCLVYMMQQTSSGLGGVGVSAAPLPLSKKSTKDTTCARHRQHAELGALASPWQPTQRYPHRGRANGAAQRPSTPRGRLPCAHLHAGVGAGFEGRLVALADVDHCAREDTARRGDSLRNGDTKQQLRAAWQASRAAACAHHRLAQPKRQRLDPRKRLRCHRAHPSPRPPIHHPPQPSCPGAHVCSVSCRSKEAGSTRSPVFTCSLMLSTAFENLARFGVSTSVMHISAAQPGPQGQCMVIRRARVGMRGSH